MKLITFAEFPDFAENLVLGAHRQESSLPELSPDDPVFTELKELCGKLEFMSERYQVGILTFGFSSSISQKKVLSLNPMVTNDPESISPLPVFLMAQTACYKLGISFRYDRGLRTYTARYSDAIELSFHRGT